ncbi:MAG: hypothetical protein EAZ31_04790 [Cytophagia bacterium]|nr:MAG: hypothetical protein EAZ31_04790 [Cytophagia bacterium]TAH28195.1 MAG: hypothetical protein EAZ06_10955 [Cytophagales bacterium]
MKNICFIYFISLYFIFSCEQKGISQSKNNKDSKEKQINENAIHDDTRLLSESGWSSRFTSKVYEKDTWKQPDSAYRVIVKKYAHHKKLAEFKMFAFFLFSDAGELVKHLRFVDDGSKEADRFIKFYKKEYLTASFQHPSMAVVLLKGLAKRESKHKVRAFAEAIMLKNKKRYLRIRKEQEELYKNKNMTKDDKINFQDNQDFIKHLDEFETYLK